MSRIIAISKGLDQNDVYTQRELGSVASNFLQSADGFIARQMFAACPVQEQRGIYRRYNKADLNRDEMQPRADGAQSSLTKFREDTATYNCNVFSLATDVGPQTRANNPKADVVATRSLSRKGLIKGERLFATTFWGTGIWTTEYTGADNTPDADDEVLPWTDPDADPIEQIETAIAAYNLVAAGFPINRMAFSEDLWTVFKNHPKVISRFNNGQTTGGARVTRQGIGDLLEIERVLVARAVHTTSAPGAATESFERILSTGLLMTHATSMPSIEEPSAGYHFDWTGYTSNASATGALVTEEPVPNSGGALRYTLELATEAHLVSADLGIWFEAMLTAAA